MKPRVAFFDFTGCEGCQLEVLNFNLEIVDLIGAVDIVEFREASSDHSDEYDIAFIEGSQTTQVDVERIQKIREKGVKAGISLNPATPLALAEEVLADIDLLLIMTVNPGFGGQEFIRGSLEKIQRARALINSRAPGVLLEVDGGVKLDNILTIRDAGADIFVAGSAIFHSGDYAKTIGEMKKILDGTAC